MRKIILLLFINCSAIVCSGQIFRVNEKPIPPYKDADVIKVIREKMNTIDEKLLGDAPKLQPVSAVIDTVFTGNYYVKQKINSLSYGYIDNKLSRLTVVVNNGLTDNRIIHDVINNPSHVINFYFDGSGLISIMETYVNQSRMGSCGSVGIIKSVYYRERKEVWNTIEQNPYPCYSETIVPEYYTTILKKLNIEF
jgi:hypothetical protein